MNGSIPSIAFLKKHLLGGGDKSVERERASSKVKEQVSGVGAIFGEIFLQRCFQKHLSHFLIGNYIVS